MVQKNLSGRTVENHIQNAEIFFKQNSSVQDFLLEIKQTKSPATYKNYLATLKILFRDYLKQPELIQDFKFPKQSFRPKILPSKEQLRIFYNALPSDRERLIFLLLASSGLRISELLSADIDKANRMLIPKSHTGETKQSWISFYNSECDALLIQDFRISRKRIQYLFKITANQTGINIMPQTLRSVFAREMSLRGVSDRYIDAFCGRVPQSVLARHYSDFSPEALKEIYEKANLKYFS